ncbi:MAG: site-specific DNA-methyltransferase [Gammaproteobacteria bacterium]|nr:site-specific DNA-methyltransferase [Gammaproteobacteria bacterium]
MPTSNQAAISSSPPIAARIPRSRWLNQIHRGNCVALLGEMPAGSVDLSFWSPPYFVGKSYEKDWTFEDWQALLRDAIGAHFRVLKSAGFMVVNIGDILCFSDPDMPAFQANLRHGKKHRITREEVLAARKKYPDANRHRLAEILNCSEQTVQRRLENNNVRGGKHSAPTKTLLVGGMLQQWAEDAGLYLYDRRIWHKDPCWANSRWHGNSYRAVDEFEHLLVFWKPGIVEVDRRRLSPKEWSAWGSRGVWRIPSVARNARHEAEFPEALAERVVRLYSAEGDVVLDPFCGSGTTLAVAKRHMRKYIGIEIDEEYVAMASKRVSNKRRYGYGRSAACRPLISSPPATAPATTIPWTSR